MSSYESMNFDVVIVGAGPAGLSCAIKLKQLNPNLSVCIVEKGASVGAHSLSGAVLEPSALKELLPEQWQDAPLDTPVSHDKFYWLTKNHRFRLPTPGSMNNHGNFIISLSEFTRFLANIAESMGVDIYPGFAASDILYNDNNEVIGIKTGDMGVDKQGEHTPNYQSGMHLLARQTIFAEGCRGQLSQELMEKYSLRKDSNPQTYALGIKEIWRVKPENHRAGEVVHTVGWPLTHDTYGGSFIYHLSDNRISIGFVVGLDYKNPWLSPYEEMQRFKTHPLISKLLEGGERLSYGARALVEGGLQSLPKLTVPGAILIGDGAGFLNVPKIKGIHMAMKSGMCAAESCVHTLADNESDVVELTTYPERIKASFVYDELYQVRNIRPGFKYGLIPGLVNAAFEYYFSRGKSPWTLTNHADHQSLVFASKAKKINYPKPDGILTFDRLSSVYLTNTYHEENQPCHLVLKDAKKAIDINYHLYQSPETRYCPAGVYEIIESDGKHKLNINAQNCIHCKTCDIKDPTQNIIWKAPEGGGGPNYVDM